MSSPLADVAARLAEQGIPFEVIRVGSDAVVVLSEYGSRVYGPFFGERAAENWLPDAFRSQDAFAELVRSGGWNLGGDRVWIGPEIAYMIPERSDYWGSYRMPADIDPGRGVLRTASEGAPPGVVRSIRAESFTTPGILSLRLSMAVTPAASPLRRLRDALPDPGAVRYAGYTVTAALTVGEGSALGLEVESWVLNQVRAGGTAIVPGTDRIQVTDYYEPVGGLLTRGGHHIEVRLTGADRFKIGFAAPTVFGRLGYLRDETGGVSVLVVRDSAADASADYAEEPDFAPGTRGDQLHLYNDDGGLGGFAELEARGLPLRTGRWPASTVDRFTTWWFRGESSAVRGIASTLLGHAGPQRHEGEDEGR